MYAKVDVTTWTNYLELPTGEREGVMLDRMVITAAGEIGTLELNFTSQISGLGGFTFDSRWNMIDVTGIFAGVHAKGTFYTDPLTGAPIISGVYW